MILKKSWFKALFHHSVVILILEFRVSLILKKLLESLNIRYLVQYHEIPHNSIFLPQQVVEKIGLRYDNPKNNTIREHSQFKKHYLPLKSS